jgi:HPt (histidine-containing phosphotransfer) domain-containing protein
VREAHSLKSAAATFGCRGLSELAADLEEGVAARGADGLDEAIDAMKTEFERARLLLSAAVEATLQAA